MKACVALLICLLSSVANAKDVALILSDVEQQAFLRSLDAYVRTQGLQVVPEANHLFEKLKAAPVVTGQTNDVPDQEKDKDK